jgi:branched-chain amino acid transport system ATP-binding protein
MTLTLESVTCGYGGAPVVHAVSESVRAGEVLCLLGRNGAGKTTLLKAVMGLIPVSGGRVTLDGRDLSGRPTHTIASLGVAYVPQGRGLWPYLTVGEHLRIGWLARRGRDDARETMVATVEPIFDLFPTLKERLTQRAGTLSGGEQQMVATARALCANPAVLLLDEPTEGLMPLLVDKLLDAIRALRARGVGVLLVEQRVDAALAVGDRVAVMETGRIRAQGTPAEVTADGDSLLRYLGVRR